MFLCKHGSIKLALDSPLASEALVFVPKWLGTLMIIIKYFSTTLKINITKHITSEYRK